MKAIVLGATGLVGSAIVRRLRANSDIVVMFPGFDIRGGFDFLKLDFQADAIFHAVECVKDISSNGVPDFDQVLDNVLVDTNVVKGWQKYQPQAKLVAFSSLWAYPAVGEIFRPEDCGAGKLDWKTAQYGAAKQLLIRSLAATDAVVLTLPNVYGSGDRSSRIVPTILQAALQAKDLVLKSDGTERRSFAYVDDVAKIAVKAVSRSGICHVVGRPSTIKDLVEIARLVLGHTNIVTFGEYVASSRMLARGILDEDEYTSLEDGLRRTVESVKASGNV